MDKGIQQGGLPEAIEDSNKIQRFNDTSGEVGKIDLGVGKLGTEEKGFLIPDHSPDNMEMEMMEGLIVQNQVLEPEGEGIRSISLCSTQKLSQGEETDGSWLDNMSNGDNDQLEQDVLDQGEWKQGKSTKKRSKKKTQVKATRHNSRLKNHGGMSIEELAATRKKKHNLETPGNKQPNTFAIINDVDDNVLIQTAKDLEISLDDNEVGCKEIISAMKAEERLRANLAEANYRAHLERLKHKECIQEDDILDLA
jgi:hypothetical protein